MRTITLKASGIRSPDQGRFDWVTQAAGLVCMQEAKAQRDCNVR